MNLFPVEVGVADLDAHLAEVVVQFVILVGDVEQGLGGDTADVEAGSSQASSLLDTDSVESQLSCFDGSDITYANERVVPPGPPPITARS